MAAQTIQSTKPITITQNGQSVVYDRILIGGVQATQSIQGPISARAMFYYCRLDGDKVLLAPLPPKPFELANLMADQDMAQACGMFFQKFVERAMAAGNIA